MALRISIGLFLLGTVVATKQLLPLDPIEDTVSPMDRQEPHLNPSDLSYLPSRRSLGCPGGLCPVCVGGICPACVGGICGQGGGYGGYGGMGQYGGYPYGGYGGYRRSSSPGGIIVPKGKPYYLRSGPAFDVGEKVLSAPLSPVWP